MRLLGGKKGFSAVLAGALLFAVGCSGDGPAPDRTLHLRTYRAQVPASLTRLSLNAITFGGVQSFDASGKAEILLPDGRTQVGIVVDSRTDRMVLLSYSFPEWLDRVSLERFISRDGRVKVDAESTALALSMINPLFFGTTVTQKADVAEKAITLPEFEQLVSAIEESWEDEPTLALDYARHPEVFLLAHDVAVGAARTLVADSVAGAPRRLSVDQDAAWIEQVKGLQTVFKNPKMIYYGGGVYTSQADDQHPTATVLILDKEKVIDFSIWPPSFQIVPAQETPYSLPGSGYWRIGIFKGFDLNMPLQQMWDTPPAQLAFIANTWQTVIMIISLAGDTGLVPGAGQAGSFLRNAMSFDDIYPIYQAFQTGDQVTIINAFVAFFSAHWMDIASFIFSSVQSNGGDTQATSSLLSKVGQLAGIATSLFNVVNVEVPFFYDLITAHPKAEYSLQDGAVTGSRVQKSGCVQATYGHVENADMTEALVSLAMALAPLLIVIYMRRRERRAAILRRLFASEYRHPR
ncbi:MAG: hypothetical protein HYY13_01035 [Nitrospirae bacterium]|nr:hypothetical protein [Nitrospirota bacterium]